ncbi:MAG TPA: hypothetical protein VEG60_06260 [Candidatus Binatia bacterium]|nr:hypothetical protein [Candidatus Binatia bacterium]
MTELVVALWWIFLVAALLVTLVDVYLLVRVVRFCRQIRALTRVTLPAAANIAKNTEAGQELGQTIGLLRALSEKSAAVQRLTGTIAAAFQETR